MTRVFQQIIDEIIHTEGGYVDHPSDRGGPTNFGITTATALAYGWRWDIKDMPRKFAEDIYMTRYITAPQFHNVYDISATIGVELIDTGVNMGPATAAIFLQRWLNAFGVSGGDLFVDGRIGPATLRALTEFVNKRGQPGIKILFRALNGVQAVRYLEISERDKSQRAFVYGWIANRVQA